jgi:L-ribulose-5-phosphate 3-epimerase UlaE
MADPITIDDIYALFQVSQAEADRYLARLERIVTAQYCLYGAVAAIEIGAGIESLCLSARTICN